MFSRGFLEELRFKAVRKRVLFRALDRVERGILYLCTRVVDRVSSVELGVLVLGIVKKLQDAFKSVFTRHVESFGCKRTIEMVQAALGFGSEVAREWLAGVEFARYLAFLDYYQPAGWGSCKRC
jgi:hypothetical protein